ncbi:class III chitinase-like protein [Ophiobolus disseminans]|uniref:Class III chitinase-like protein n=1 Tax=Ophiobolus disseminans TaxID=1469910 RepID=A0A6A7A7P6_9PLEO|nr:class III chitinase-like protein [Ophiobolus disseminans]
MNLFKLVLWTLIGFSQALMGFDPHSKANLAVYWGQNSVNTHVIGRAQSRLVDYCNDPSVNIILIAFLVTITDGHGNFKPILDVANQDIHCDHSKSPYTCPQIEEDIKMCQEKNKMILLSFGGATSPERGFDNEEKARRAAAQVWAMFGPPKSDPSDATRPFGKSVVDGFDFAFEGEIPGMGAFGQELYKLMGGKNKGGRIITAAPQCPLPGRDSMFNQIPLDAVFVQFYNNPQCNYNFHEWNDWAANKHANWFIGLPASEGAGAGYIPPGGQLDSTLRRAKALDHMGGAMLWDFSQAVNNHNYHTAVKKALTGQATKMFRG